MKKTYITPNVMVANIATGNLLAGSNPSVFDTQADAGSTGLGRRRGVILDDCDDWDEEEDY